MPAFFGGTAVAAALATLTAWSLPARAEPNQMISQLTHLRSQVMILEKDLIEGLKQQRQAKANAARMQKLMGLQRKERELGKKRLGELEATVMELEARRSTLSDKVRTQQLNVRKSLAELGRSLESTPTALGTQGEALEAPRRKLLARFADRGIREIEELKIDLADAEQLESRIQEEKQQLAYLFQDLQEQESVMALNRLIQLELFKKRHEERVSQLESYRKLKSSESQVERLIGQFNSRKELQRQVESDRAVTQNLASVAGMDGANGLGGAFAKLKGRLPLPVADARLVAGFGRNFDPKSKLFIFKKGVDLAVGKNTSVRSIYPGKIAYSGELPEYGRVTIVDHGDHFYSLCAHLGELTRKTGDAVAAGDVIGVTEESGNPLYFEIRARNVAVNPLQWVSNSFTLKE